MLPLVTHRNLQIDLCFATSLACAGVAELVDAPDLGSGAGVFWRCQF